MITARTTFREYFQVNRLTSSHDGLLLDLRQYPKIASLKHSQLGLDFFEEAYLGACPYQFVKVSLDNLENVLDYLKAELE